MKLQNLYLKKNLLGEEREDSERKHFATMAYNTTKCSLTKRYIVPSEVREGKQTKFTVERENKTNKDNWTKI